MKLFDPAADDPTLLAALHKTSFSVPWSREAIAALLTGPGVFAFFTGGGFVMGRQAGGEAEILTLAVTPAARGHGMGRSLLRASAAHAVLQGADTMFLEVGTDNPAALALYGGLGFGRVGLRRGYYEGKDAWVLRAALPLSPNEDFA